MVRRSFFYISITALIILMTGVAGFAEEKTSTGEEFDSTAALIEILKQKGILSDKEADTFINRHQKEQQKSGEVITIIPEEEEKEYLQKITEEVMRKVNDDLNGVKREIETSADDLMTRDRLQNREIKRIEKIVTEDHEDRLRKSAWAERIRFGGDIRLRYQKDTFNENNALLLDPSNPSELMNTRVDRSQYRYRVRVYVKVKVIDPREINVGKLEAGLRLATGNESNPISTNDTFGDYMNKDSFVLDRAYLRWTFKPEDTIWGGRIPRFAVTGGRMPNPWDNRTDLVWDKDLNFEGLTFNLRTDTLDDRKPIGFFTIGAFPLHEEEWSQRDKWLYGVQAGIEQQILSSVKYTLSAAYYDYENIQGVPNSPLYPGVYDFTAPQYQTKGNTLFDIDPDTDILPALAADYNLLNLTGKLDLTHFFPTHVIVVVDYVKNLGFDVNEVAYYTGNPSQEENTTGYQLGLTVGQPLVYDYGDWNTSLFYKYLEADAVLDAFTDSDFHLGGTNAKGWVLGAQYGIYRNTWLTGRYLTSDEINGPPLAIDTFQLDLNVKF